MEKAAISKNQRRIILLVMILSFFAVLFWRVTAPEEKDGVYSIVAIPADNPETSVDGTAEITYNEDNGNFYFQMIELETGEIIYLYDEAAPVSFENKNYIHDEEENDWTVYVNERVDQLGTADKIKVIVPNILYWTVIIILFLMKSFINDLIAILEVKKEDPKNFHKLDSWAYKMGTKLEHWRNNTKKLDRIYDLCKLLGLFLAVIWFLHQYNII